MASEFQTKTVNGIDIQFWQADDATGRSEARSLAASLPRGGKIDNGSIREIEAPISAGSTVEVWLDGDGFSNFKIPDDYEVETVSGFDMPGVCIEMRKSE